MRQGFIKVAALTPKVTVADTQANRKEICRLMDEAEAKGYTQQENVEEAVRALYEKSGNLVFVTLGAEGTLFYDGKEMRRVASVKTNVVDTVGAGDSHIGAIIAGMSKGMKVEGAVLLANCTAAAIVGTSGPVMDLEEFQKISEEWENE